MKDDSSIKQINIEKLIKKLAEDDQAHIEQLLGGIITKYYEDDDVIHLMFEIATQELTIYL